ncbi:hypothetical protein H5410_030383 [Solanum commersonii]|uniref:Uncharacterized protein n=1 Tax=Solanum commersonii TaxID=4109 RepID=A0A9J5YG10_SOLCO|nr:hypothetical protein H5410_030383 [Solanum commersonii]
MEISVPHNIFGILSSKSKYLILQITLKALQKVFFVYITYLHFLSPLYDWIGCCVPTNFPLKQTCKDFISEKS